MTKVVFLDRKTVGAQIAITRPRSSHSWQMYDTTDPDEVVDRLQGAQVVLNNKVKLSAEILAQAPDVQMISLIATGYDCVDIAYCKAHDIVVSNVRGYAKHTVPEHVFSLLLALRRNLFAYRQEVIDGHWETASQFCLFHHPVRDLVGSTLVLVGSGSLGQGVATIARGFGMKVVFAARKGQSDFDLEKYMAWDDALACADVLSLHCPLTEQTQNLIDKKAFEKMARKPVLINTARGGLVNEQDLVEAIEAGMISGAGFDVAETEPLGSNSPLKAIVNRPDFILTPHMAWASDHAQQTLIDQAVENIDYFIQGNPRNNVCVE